MLAAALEHVVKGIVDHPDDVRINSSTSPRGDVLEVHVHPDDRGRVIEEIGKYHPTEEPSFIEVDSERAQYWLSVGAQPTEQVAALLKLTGHREPLERTALLEDFQHLGCARHEIPGRPVGEHELPLEPNGGTGGCRERHRHPHSLP